jgi:hypothetical protein
MSERIEIYKILIDTITAKEARRQQVTSVNISLLVASMAALGGIRALDPIFIAVPALPLSVIWLSSLLYFRRLAKAKWHVVSLIEQELEIQAFSTEHKKFQEYYKIFRLELSQIEMFIPLAIMAVSLGYLVWRLIGSL